MGQMEFKMERTGLLNVGDVLQITEYYTTLERLKTQDGKTEGKVVDIKETPKGFYVTVEYQDS